jgi:hypothetical protein
MCFSGGLDGFAIKPNEIWMLFLRWCSIFAIRHQKLAPGGQTQRDALRLKAEQNKNEKISEEQIEILDAGSGVIACCWNRSVVSPQSH